MKACNGNFLPVLKIKKKHSEQSDTKGIPEFIKQLQNNIIESSGRSMGFIFISGVRGEYKNCGTLRYSTKPYLKKRGQFVSAKMQENCLIHSTKLLLKQPCKLELFFF